jgi:hypothetical protein
MVLPLFSPLGYICAIAGPEEAKNLGGENVFRLIQIRLAPPSLEKTSQACQAFTHCQRHRLAGIRVVRGLLRISPPAKFGARLRPCRLPLHRPR